MDFCHFFSSSKDFTFDFSMSHCYTRYRSEEISPQGIWGSSVMIWLPFIKTSSAAFTLRVVGSSSKGSFSLRTLLNLQLFNNNSFSKQMTNMRKHTPFSPHDFYLFHVIIQFQADHSVTVCWPDSHHFFLVIVLTWPFNNITVCWPESYHFFWWLCVDLTIL